MSGLNEKDIRSQLAEILERRNAGTRLTTMGAGKVGP